MIRRWLAVVLVGTLASCGEAPAPEEAADPVVLSWMDAPPACLTEMDPSLIRLPGPEYQLLMMQEMEHSFQEQYAQLLVGPILKDPTNLEWNTGEGATRLEGRTLARGRDWGILSVGLTSHAPGAPRAMFLGADIHYSLMKTRFQFDNADLEYTRDYRRMNGHIRGCDSFTGYNFEVGPATVNGQSQPRVVMCWRDPSLRFPLVDTSSPLQCLQMVHALVPDAFPQGQPMPPAMFLY